MIVDIRCPDCGRTDPVRKMAIGRYRCAACGCEFSRGDVVEQV